MTRGRTQRVALSGLFLSVMLVLGYVESMIPIGGLPGVKLGLSNSVLLFSLYWVGIAPSFTLMALKVLLSTLLFGNPNMMLYSLAGGLLSMLVMVLCIFVIRGLSPVSAGAMGAVFHNVGQILVATWQLNNTGLLYTYLPLLIVAGVVTGSLTGMIAARLMKHLPMQMKEKSR